MDASGSQPSLFKTWTLIVLLVVLIFFMGAFSYLVVGDLGQPGWDYRPARDVPGESPYALYRPLPYPQHIKGEKGE